jgi:hypothetical protein
VQQFAGVGEAPEVFAVGGANRLSRLTVGGIVGQNHGELGHEQSFQYPKSNELNGIVRESFGLGRQS